MKSLAAFLGLIGALTLMAAPSSPTPDAIRQWHGSLGGKNVFSARAIRDEEGWVDLWKELHQDPPCKFDPNLQTAVVIDLGFRGTAGFKPRVTASYEKDGNLMVEYTAGAPPPGSMTAQMTTAPWVVALVDPTKLPVVFRETKG